jgi:phage-related minor tail protein
MGPGMGAGGGRRFEEALERMKTENPERYARISKIKDLAGQYRTATDANDKKKIEKELRPLLETELKQIQADNQKKLEDLQRRLDDEKRKQKEREQNWNGYMDFQFNRITGEGDYLELPLGPWK